MSDELKLSHVTEGIMTFAHALIRQHNVDQQVIFTRLKATINRELNLIEGNDPDRNR